MPFSSIPEVGMQWGSLLASRHDIARPERSPGLSGFFGLLLATGLALATVVLLDPAAAIDAVSDGRRAGLAVIGVFVFPFALAVLGVVGLIWWSRRWRVPGGGKLTDACTIDFDRTDPARVWHTLETASSENDPALVDLLEELKAEGAQPRSTYQLWVKHSPADRLMVGIVVTKIPKKSTDPQGGLRSQLDREPVVRRGGDYVDLSRVTASA